MKKEEIDKSKGQKQKPFKPTRTEDLPEGVTVGGGTIRFTIFDTLTEEQRKKLKIK